MNPSISEVATPRRVPAGVMMLLALAAAFGFRWIGGELSRDREPLGEQIVFLGVAVAAAGLASLVARVWATPTAAIVLGTAAGFLATQFDDSVQGAVIGLIVGAIVAVGLTWRMSRWVVRAVTALGASALFGATIGGGIGACVLSGGALGTARAVGVAFSSWLIILAFHNADASRQQRWSQRLAFAAGLVGGAVWLSGPLLAAFTQ